MTDKLDTKADIYIANRTFTRQFYTFHEYPVLIDCNFIVDSTNGNGFGARALKGEGVKAVYMNTSASLTGTVATTANQITAISGGTSSLTPGMPVQGTGIPAGTTITSILSSSAVSISATPTGNHASESITYQAAGSPGVIPAGYIYVQFTDAYYRYFGGFSGFVSPVSGTPLTSTTSGTVYTIVSLGTATPAQWLAAGLPNGVTPAVGASFVAIATGTIGGSAAVEVPAAAGSGVDHIEAIGDANQTIHTSGFTNGVRNPPYLICACYFEGAVTAPANGTAISLASYLSNSSNEVRGE